MVSVSLLNNSVWLFMCLRLLSWHAHVYFHSNCLSCQWAIRKDQTHDYSSRFPNQSRTGAETQTCTHLNVHGRKDTHTGEQTHTGPHVAVPQLFHVQFFHHVGQAAGGSWWWRHYFSVSAAESQQRFPPIWPNYCWRERIAPSVFLTLLVESSNTALIQWWWTEGISLRCILEKLSSDIVWDNAYIIIYDI